MNTYYLLPSFFAVLCSFWSGKLLLTLMNLLAGSTRSMKVV